MKLTLKDFQEQAVDDLAGHSGRARVEAEEDQAQSLVLAAPTGSGKTMIAIAWMERLLNGDDKRAPDPNATFLWITDQPELNEQTRRKFEFASTMFFGSKLVTIDASFGQEIFDPGRVYFLNTQKLGKGQPLVTPGDRHTRTIWETINRTGAERPGSFWVVLDEAHKGMTENASERDQARTIVQRFIKGWNDALDPVPLIFGISATPDRFTELLAATPRTNRPPVVVLPEDVRSSGLLKEAITLYHPDEAQPSDLTFVQQAAQRLQRFAGDWSLYAQKEDAPRVRPILVVQVEDASGNKPTRTKLDEALSKIEDVLGPLDDSEVAHSFQEDYALTFGARDVRYVRAADIQDDQDLRVVFFKKSLTTGWDCPRAEVMMSFRRQVDKTVIAQLVGRMVRTPLARAVSGTEFLNTVCLYLPHYDRKALDAVIEYLTDPDPEIGIPTNVQVGNELASLERNPDTADAFDAAESLPTYRIEKISKQTNTRRLLRLGRYLAWDKIDKGAPETYRNELVAVLEDERKKVASKAEFKQRVQEAGVIDVRAVTVGIGEADPTAVATSQVAAVAENVEHAFAEAGRKIGGGLHSEYLVVRSNAKKPPPVSQIKLELYALAQDQNVVDAVESRAGELLAQALEARKTDIRKLSDERRQLYRQVRRQAAKPEPEDWELPDAIEVPKGEGKRYEKHLYVDDEGKFSAKPKLNDWEDEVISTAIGNPDVVGWLRNDPRKPWALSIPYKKGAEDRPMYPDFLVFRRSGSGIVCDIYEPHAPAWADSVGKAKGLAEFALRHGDDFGDIELIAKIGGTLKRLSLNDTEIRDRILTVGTSDELHARFGEA